MIAHLKKEFDKAIRRQWVIRERRILPSSDPKAAACNYIGKRIIGQDAVSLLGV